MVRKKTNNSGHALSSQLVHNNSMQTDSSDTAKKKTVRWNFDHNDESRRRSNDFISSKSPHHSESSYDGLTTNQLKVELKKKGLKTTGRKSTLLNRLSSEMTLNGDTLKRRNVTPTAGLQCNGDLLVDSSTEYPNKGGKEEQFIKSRMKSERESLVLWKRPLVTLLYFIRESILLFKSFVRNLMKRKRIVLITFLVICTIVVSMRVTGPHQPILRKFFKEGKWSLYWLGLGVLSSIGLGTGLHTFLLYLGPHIAAVTISAYECHSLNFPEPPYPDQIICPQIIDPAWTVSLWSIMSKVKLESIMWGAGTALGELPPYFMARTARLSGCNPEDEDDELREFEELQQKKTDPNSMTFVDKLKLSVENIVNRVGFFGILACASVPNPLFDLAGITCGHFLIPFWTFFGATLIGKAVIKMTIQVLFVIIAFNETLIEKAIKIVSKVPLVGKYLEAPVIEFLDAQKRRLHSGTTTNTRTSNLSLIFDVLVTLMVTYFLISIINSMAQHYHKRINKSKVFKNDLKTEVRDD